MRLFLLNIIQRSDVFVQAVTLLLLVWVQITTLRKQFTSERAKKTIWLIFATWLTGLLAYAAALWIYFSGSIYATALLPPRSNFLTERITQGIVTHISGAIGAAVVFFLLRYFFIQKKRGTKLDETDILLLSISSLAVGWPTMFIFLAMVFALSVVGMLVLVVLRKKTIYDRLVITPFIIPAAIVTLWAGPYLLIFTHLNKISF